ncbi:xenobiotic compound monooxygenase [Verticillium alfalfae VaMs.102]|uniref:Xenobiotic compound monooxygenase n=1 Tax=Verticillium alfalfae (strain VaMs.102 / ATCC MYA-4576 / FGSC 10136) TaxID=526221 RepID=C9S7Y6_VERA1|nr:xenobiotic compound monooxygenase [Verticillium alfalfae VaMs.102]EEY15276.1 xenobiotic compound monooxygenase [Verticillium alfalfae VaMs.102]
MGDANNTPPSGATPKKSLIVNAFVEMCSGHQSPGLWRHPDDQSHNFNSTKHWVDLAKLLEKAKFHGVFIADVLGGYDVYNKSLEPAITSGAQWPVNEPLAVVSAMAAATESIGFGVTVSTTYEQPYHLARRLATLDHLTGGRYLDSAAKNMGLTEQPQFAAQHAEAVFVSAHAPAVCAKNVAEIRALADSGYGRNGKDIKVLALVTPILGRTEEEAQAKLADYRQYASLEGALALFGGWTGIDLGQYGDEQELRQVESNAVRSTVEGYARFSPGTAKWTKHTIAEHVSIGGNGPVLVGTAEQVADGLETWVREADVDGFNFSFEDIIELLLPDCAAPASSGRLRRTAGTYRETSTDVRAKSSSG